MLKPVIVVVLAISLADCAGVQPPAPAWQAFADCAAAYRANAALVDPGRPASMTAMISDVAHDYEAAALATYRKARPSASEGVVQERISTQAKVFAGKPRAVVEMFIDACPQTDP